MSSFKFFFFLNRTGLANPIVSEGTVIYIVMLPSSIQNIKGRSQYSLDSIGLHVLRANLKLARSLLSLGTYLHKFAREFIGEEFFFLLIIDSKSFFLLLQSLDLLEQRVADELLFLFCSGLLQIRKCDI